VPLQLWTPSIIDWQSVFLPHAPAGLAHALSTHLPQSLSPNAGAGGGAAGAADDAAGAAEVSVADEESDVAGMSAAADDAGALAPPSSPDDADSSAGVSGGLPPPQASQVRGPVARRRNDRVRLRAGAIGPLLA
jgi:hypothetical protein